MSIVNELRQKHAEARKVYIRAILDAKSNDELAELRRVFWQTMDAAHKAEIEQEQEVAAWEERNEFLNR